MDYTLNGAPDVLQELATAAGFDFDPGYWEQGAICHLVLMGILEDPFEHYGKTLGEILDQWEPDAAVQGEKLKPLFGRCELFADFRGLVIMNPLGECPVCGCSVEHEEDGFGKHTWEIRTCTHCRHRVSDEPAHLFDQERDE